MKLDVPLYKQEKGSKDCGPACLKMLYSYYGIEKSLEEIKSEIKMWQWGTYGSELGKSLLENGFDVESIAWDSRVFFPKYKNMSQKEILKHMKKRLKLTKKRNKRRWMKSLIEFMEEKGKFRPEIITIEEIKENIKDKKPVILCIEKKSLYGKNKGDSGHFLIVSGFENDSLIVNDPHPKHGGIRKYPIYKILFALYSWRSSTLLI